MKAASSQALATPCGVSAASSGASSERERHDNGVVVPLFVTYVAKYRDLVRTRDRPLSLTAGQLTTCSVFCPGCRANCFGSSGFRVGRQARKCLRRDQPHEPDTVFGSRGITRQPLGPAPPTSSNSRSGRPHRRREFRINPDDRIDSLGGNGSVHRSEMF